MSCTFTVVVKLIFHWSSGSKHTSQITILVGDTCRFPVRVNNIYLHWDYRKVSLLFSQQPPLNAQMLAQRQRELYSIQHRQRQLFQQKVMLMRQNMAGAPTGAVGPIGTARVPKGPATTPQQQQQQQFNFPAGYNPMTGNPPTSPSQFSPMSGGPLDNKLSVRVPLNNQTLIGGVQGQFSSTVNSSLQQGLFQQFGGSGEFKEICFTVDERL